MYHLIGSTQEWLLELEGLQSLIKVHQRFAGNIAILKAVSLIISLLSFNEGISSSFFAIPWMLPQRVTLVNLFV